MTIGERIAQYRKEKGLTQEALAKTLDVTNQAVSKWESDQCCPDIQLLPKLADVFGVSLDALFGRQIQQPRKVEGLPWADDRTLRVVLYQGHTLLQNNNGEKELSFRYEGPAVDVVSAVNVSCGDVGRDVDAGGNVACGIVGVNVDAGGSVTCGDVEGSVDAGSSVKCGNVGGDVDAGTHVTCAAVSGDVDAGGNVKIG